MRYTVRSLVMVMLVVITGVGISWGANPVVNGVDSNDPFLNRPLMVQFSNDVIADSSIVDIKTIEFIKFFITSEPEASVTWKMVNKTSGIITVDIPDPMNGKNELYKFMVNIYNNSNLKYNVVSRMTSNGCEFGSDEVLITVLNIVKTIENTKRSQVKK